MPSVKKIGDEKAKQHLVGITFDDIQKMHYSNLNSGKKDDDAFNPQDFLDLDSGDSDNEILSSFKQPSTKSAPPYVDMISL